MRLFLAVALTMVAFAANSVLNRAALADGAIGPAAFAAIRLGSGALALCLIVAIRREGFGLAPRNGTMALALLAYILGFSFAYLSLDAGLGALILFGGVQITMFAGALIAGEAVPRRRWLGAGIAFAGLVVLFAPGAAGPDPVGVLLMSIAAIGWGIYSLKGRGVAAPLPATAVNFALASPVALLLVLLIPDTVPMSAPGVVLAVVSGVVTSGLGYALWYAVLPHLRATVAGVAQLTVPIIALGGGVVFLGEGLTLGFMLAAVMVLGGVAVSLGKA
ncbi:drug/metabolite transporter (DMT)-like permease [Rubricella aquisinus]|uniref:Drug/metabolite transporter (DMT)-like permease n=1 Tax=Rubricella aquisinus TaxID=2028108 RepID=A0A840X0A2_9RHOB|nr:DMT family transporter [Rubricella aquisinus]MBB5514087.1 drug/metabolite transporter (DMT)-like permease [Rubricella aquisinus]